MHDQITRLTPTRLPSPSPSRNWLPGMLFSTAVNSPAPAPAAVPEAADERSAECCARVVQNASQHASAPDRTEPHETTEPAAAKRLTAGSSEVTPFIKTAEMAGTGFEPATSRL